MHDLVEKFVFFFAVIDPVGSVPVFLAVTSRYEPAQKKKIARVSVSIAAAILVAFVIVGELLLDAMGVPLSAFQIAGGIVLFLFALTMIFGEGKPEEEMRIARSGEETAVFPMAVPSIASPGAMLAAVVLTDNHRFSPADQVLTTLVMLAVLVITFVLLRCAQGIHAVIGNAGAGIVSRVMGLILTAVATTSVLEGVTEYFEL